jgi:hypothetical protein
MATGRSLAGAVHMRPMTTDSSRLMFSHRVPTDEPPLGTVAIFRGAFIGGGGSSTGMFVRTARGWSEDPSGRDALSWESLTDLATMNARILARNPSSTAAYGAVDVKIVAHPGNYRARFIELESAVYAAAERLHIPTRRFIAGIGTQDVNPVSLIRSMEDELTEARA